MWWILIGAALLAAAWLATPAMWTYFTWTFVTRGFPPTRRNDASVFQAQQSFHP
jgi:hypothetical protein